MLAALIALAAMAASEPAAPPESGLARHNAAVAAVKEGKLRYYPRRAHEHGVSGRVLLDCVVAEDGWLGACTVVDETPTGWRFGDTALAMSPLFNANNGRPSAELLPEGAHFRFPIEFKPPE